MTVEHKEPGWNKESLTHRRPAALDVTPEELAAYLATARRRRERQQRERACRRACAWDVARQAATVLQGQAAVTRVLLFGSLARHDRFDVRSDVDLAVWGLDEQLYYRLVARLLELDPAIDIDLVRAEDAPPALLKAIEQAGIAL
jgi:predicted nucleotidyltransferase